MDQIHLLHSRIGVLADLPTLEAAAQVMEPLARRENPTTQERMEFGHAARRELGLDRRWWPARVKSGARRRLRYWRKKIAKRRHAGPAASD